MRKVAPLEPGDAKVRHRWPLQRCILLQGLLVESTGAVGEVMHPLPIQMSIDGGGDYQQRTRQTEETDERAPVEVVNLRVP
jgi:hypothetical protein